MVDENGGETMSHNRVIGLDYRIMRTFIIDLSITKFKKIGDSKLDAVEKELIQALEQEEDASDSMDIDEGEKYRANLNRIADDIRKLKNSLVATRNTIWEKNQKDFEAQVEKLEQERRSLNERAELDLVKQLRDFYEKKKPKSETNYKTAK